MTTGDHSATCKLGGGVAGMAKDAPPPPHQHKQKLSGRVLSKLLLGQGLQTSILGQGASLLYIQNGSCLTPSLCQPHL